MEINENVGDDITTLLFTLSHFLSANESKSTWIIDLKAEKNGLFNIKRNYFLVLTKQKRFQQAQDNLSNFCKDKKIETPKILNAELTLTEEGADRSTLTIKSNYSIEELACELGSIVKKYKNELFNFNQQINDLKNLAIKVLEAFAQIAELNLSQLRLSEIKAEKTYFSGIPDLVQYEVDFAASGSQLIYPNPLEMSEDHVTYIMRNKERNPFAISSKVLPNIDQVLLQYRYYYFIYLFHEIFHCFQTLNNQSDPNNGWSFEHDASFISSIIMLHASKLGTHESKKYFKPGKTEETMLFFADEGISTHNFLLKENGDEYLKGYEKWRESFGYEKPVSQDSFSFAESNIRVLDYYKTRITSEAYIEYYN